MRTETMTVIEAAKYLGISPNSLRKHKAQGTGPSYLALGPEGGKIRFRAKDLDTWLESRCVQAKTTKGRLNHITE